MLRRRTPAGVRCCGAAPWRPSPATDRCRTPPPPTTAVRGPVRSPSRPPRTTLSEARRPPRRHVRGNSAIRAASCSAVRRASPSGTTRLTRPIRGASPAPTPRPVRTRSAACEAPSSRGSRTVPPPMSATPRRRKTRARRSPRRRADRTGAPLQPARDRVAGHRATTGLPLRMRVGPVGASALGATRLARSVPKASRSGAGAEGAALVPTRRRHGLPGPRRTP